jgi:hypothetical protein
MFASEGMFKSAETVAVEVSYHLSTLDSRQSAIDAARAIARREAAQNAGTYIEGISLLENGELRESIKEVQASVVRLFDEHISYEITPNAPNGKMTLKAIAEVDSSTLRSRIQALRENRELSKKVQALALANTRLQSELRGMESPDAFGIQRLDLDRRRLRLESQISQNRESLLSAFDGGNLLDFRKKEDVHVGIKNQEMEREVIGQLMELQVYADIISAFGDDTQTTAKVRVVSEPAPPGVMHRITGWFNNPATLSYISSKRTLNHDLSIYDSRIEEGFKKYDDFNIHAMEQMKYLARFLVATEVNLGSRKTYLPVLGVSGSTFGRAKCDTRPLSLDKVLTSPWAKPVTGKDMAKAICIFNSEESQSQVIEVTVTNAEAAEISSVTARRVLIDLKKGQVL